MDKPCKCAVSFLSPHRKSKCSLKSKKDEPKKSGARCGKKENKSAEVTTCSKDDANDDTTMTTADQISLKSVTSEDNTAPLSGEIAKEDENSSDDDDMTLVSIILNRTVTRLGKKIENPDENSAEQLELFAKWGNRRCDECPLALTVPHRRIKCQFQYIANLVLNDLDNARNEVKECADSTTDQPDERNGSKNCTCFASRLGKHRKEKCSMRAFARCQVTTAVAVPVNDSANPFVAEVVVVKNESGALTLTTPTDTFSFSGFEQVNETPNPDGAEDVDDAYDDNMSMISEDEFVEYVTLHNKTYTAEQVRATFERLQDEINRLKKAQKGQNEADLPTQPSSLEATPVSPTSA